VLQLFRNNHFLNSLLLIPLIIVVHFPIFLTTSVDPHLGNGVLGVWTNEFLEGCEVWKDIFVILLIFFEAILLNRMIIIHRMSNEISLVPGYLWVLFTALHPDLIGYHALLLSVLFILIGMQSLFDTYKKSEVTNNLFNAGFFFGLASLVFAPLTLLFLFALIGVNVIRSLRPIDIRQYATAFVTPYLLVGSLIYVFGDLNQAIREQWVDSWGFFNFTMVEPIDHLIAVLLVILLTAIVLLNASAYSSKKIIYAQKKISVLFLYLFFAFVVIGISDEPSLVHAFLFLWPVAFFLSETFLLMKNTALAELFSFLLLGFALFMQYQSLL
jgi:hypothetical protein